MPKATAVFDADDSRLGAALVRINQRMLTLQSRIAKFAGAWVAVRAVAQGERGQIHVGYAPSPTVELLPSALHAFENLAPGVRVNLHDLSSEEMLRFRLERSRSARLTAWGS